MKILVTKRYNRLWIYQNHYKLKAIDLSRQKGLDADQKSILQIKLVEQL